MITTEQKSKLIRKTINRITSHVFIQTNELHKQFTLKNSTKRTQKITGESSEEGHDCLHLNGKYYIQWGLMELYF